MPNDVPAAPVPTPASVPRTEPKPVPKPGDYGSDQIKVLEGLDAVRKRPGMYIGGTGLNALHHLVYEVVDNSIDEAMAGHATVVSVSVEADGSVTVVDDGRGIPVEPMKHEDPALNGKPAVEVVLTKLHAGGKFGQEGSAYKVSGGLHGVGVSCVNALSDRLEVEVFRDGKVFRIEFERGRVTKPLTVVGPIPASAERRTGTTVTFHPDPEIFPDTTFSFQTLSTRLRELAYLNPGATVRLHDERVGPDGKPKHAVFKAEHGLVEYVEHLMGAKTAVSSPIHLRREEPGASLVCEVALQWHDGYNEQVLTFANNINNVDGGTHAQGFKTALTRTVNSYARKAGLIKEKDPAPTGEDLREGLIAVVSVKLPDPAFNNQPKEKLLNPEIEGFVSSAVAEALDAWLEENPAEARRLCQKGLVAAQAREAARKARELTRRKTALESGSMPHKLKDCRTRDVERSEIFLVEGDSAGGPAGQCRDSETQAVLPLKGKILNVEKARIDKILGFAEIRTMISALRCGIGGDFDIARLRYGKIIIMTDADVDGSHIRTLLLTFFFRQMPELIRRGYVYCAQPPLYKLARGKTIRYVLNDRELHDTLTQLGLDGAALLVRDVSGYDPDLPIEAEPPVERRLEGQPLRRAVQLLRRLRELVTISERRGAPFADMLAQRDRDPAGQRRLPTHKVSWGARDAYAWDEAQAYALVEREGLRLVDAGEATAEPGEPAETLAAGHDDAVRPEAVIRELHENRELEKVIASLADAGLNIDDYALVQEESVTGARLPARFAWETTRKGKASRAADDATDAEADDAASHRLVEAANIPAILTALHEIGRRGLEIGRFKGLGEMNDDQLWDTTMDPARRTLLRVTWDMGPECENLFSTLMGEPVEPRRKFIEEHALEVKNLDV